MRWLLMPALVFGGFVAGCSTDDRETPMSDETAATQKDPVCGMSVDPRTAEYKDEYDGKTFYFDSKDCWQKFHDNPHAYLPGGDDRDLNPRREVR